MPRARSQYIAEMRERFEVVDRVKASAEEKASLTKAIHQDDSDPSSVENTPSKVESVYTRTSGYIWTEYSNCQIHTVWTSNVVPAEIVRRPPDSLRRGSQGGLRIFLLNHW